MDKPKPLVTFFRQVNVVTLIHDHWYDPTKAADFEQNFNNLAHWFTLDKQLVGFSAKEEIEFFLNAFEKLVNQNSTAYETKISQQLGEIKQEIRQPKNSQHNHRKK